MSDELGCELCGDLPVLSVGEEVPDFEMETFEPSTGSFGEVSLANLKADG